jgi:diguanylate cyclase (GGDEF)-like protein
LLPDTTQEAATLVAENIRLSVEKMNMPHEHSTPLRIVTISIGVVASGAEAPESYETLLQQTDMAPYSAKEKGLNRVELFRGALQGAA